MIKYQNASDSICSTKGLLSFWDFQEAGGEKRKAKGTLPYVLTERNGPIRRKEEGIFGPYSADFQPGRWLSIPRADCPALNFTGADACLTIMAWVKWRNAESTGCQAIAGIWDETNRKRQYCLFVDLRIWESKHQVCGHVSSVGGPTPGYKYSMTSAIGKTALDDQWHAIAFTYDGEYAKVYLDGKLDERDRFNPYYYPEGLFDGGEHGADFTVGAVDRSNEIGNFYNGLLGGLAVFDRALSSDEIFNLYQQTMA